MSSPVINGDPHLSLLCSARVRHCLRLFVTVVDWCVSRLVRLICCRIILTASSTGRLLICRSLAIRFLFLSPSFTFRYSYARSLFLDLDPYGGTDQLSKFPLFLKRNADVMAARLSVTFSSACSSVFFPGCWRRANVTQIPIGPPSPSVTNYQPISITSVLTDRCVCGPGVCPAWTFVEPVVCFQISSLLIGKVWVPVMHFFSCPTRCKVH